MSNDPNEDLAAEYVLGTLAGAARRRFAEALAHDSALQALVEAWEQRLEGIRQHVLPVEPSAGLWDKIDAAIDGTAAAGPGSVTLHADEGEWRPLRDGIEKKTLFFDRAAASESFLLRFSAGARLPSHKHRAAEECVVLEGTFMIGDQRLEAGDFQAFEGNTYHPETYCEHGGVVYVRGELREAAG